ncbi:MAG: hypothetical protein Q9223_001484 [Gallowayella weberi]
MLDEAVKLKGEVVLDSERLDRGVEFAELAGSGEDSDEGLVLDDAIELEELVLVGLPLCKELLVNVPLEREAKSDGMEVVPELEIGIEVVKLIDRLFVGPVPENDSPEMVGKVVVALELLEEARDVGGLGELCASVDTDKIFRRAVVINGVAALDWDVVGLAGLWEVGASPEVAKMYGSLFEVLRPGLVSSVVASSAAKLL